MSAPSWRIEQHRLASDARQFGLWCMANDSSGVRRVVAYAMPKCTTETRRWCVFQCRLEVANSLTREEAHALLREIAAKTSWAGAEESPGGAK